MTNSVLAFVEDGQPTVIAAEEGLRTTPSVVSFGKNGELAVGMVARRQTITNADRTIRSVKRHMGTNWSVTIDGKKFNSQQISAFILQKLKRDAEAQLGEEITDAVITVPAYFSDAKREAAKEAGTIAGLNILRIIDEPTAAALAYHLVGQAPAKILVFDLGGGTYDVSLLDVSDGVVEVKAARGDNHLGGDDWDQRIAGWLLRDYKSTSGTDLSKDRLALQRLREAAEKAKIELSRSTESQINLPYISHGPDGPRHLDTRLTRAEFQRMTSDLLDRCKTPFQQVIKDANVTMSDIDHVVLVGGATQMPAFIELVKSLTGGKEPSKGVNPDEVVAVGASLLAGVLKGEIRADDIYGFASGAPTPRRPLHSGTQADSGSSIRPHDPSRPASRTMRQSRAAASPRNEPEAGASHTGTGQGAMPSSSPGSPAAVIEVAIRRGEAPGMFTVEVVSSAAGEATASVPLDLDSLLSRRERLQSAVLASAVATRRVLPETERPVREIGQLLFAAALGTGEVSGRYRASAALAAERGQRLRVVLRIDSPELAVLPWEAMYDQAIGDYVCRHDQLVRHSGIASVPPPLQVQPPLRILGIASSPRGLPPLDVEKEQDQLARALARPASLGLVELQWAPTATWADLQAMLFEGPWHVVHYIGHGDFDPEREEGFLSLVAENGRAHNVAAHRLVTLLRQAYPMPRLAVLNSCMGAQASTSDLFSGTAAALVRGGFSAAAAMQYEISDQAAVAFARGFYTAIAHGRDVDDALSSGRVAILGASDNTLEWLTPVLYLRGRDAQIFTIS